MLVKPLFETKTIKKPLNVLESDTHSDVINIGLHASTLAAMSIYFPCKSA